MKKIIKITIAAAIFLAAAVFLYKALPIAVRGYTMYENVIENHDLMGDIEDIRRRSGYTKLENIPEKYLEAVIKSEDKRFYYHFGIDLLATARAMFNNLKAGRYVQGGSTITQQLSKNMYFSFEKRYERKVAELLIAFKLEHLLTKDEILELYCNIAYFGENCYGIGAASMHYFGCLPSQLNEQQISSLVYTLKSPNNYNPHALAAR